MLPEISILRLLCEKQQWLLNKDDLAVNDLPVEIQGVYRCINNYFQSDDTNPDLHAADLANLFFATQPKDREFYIGLFEQLDRLQVNPETTKELIRTIKRNSILQQLSLASYEVTQGRKPYSEIEELYAKLDKQEEQLDREELEEEFVTSNLEELLNATYQQPGLRWRLNTLTRMLGSLRQGDFGFIFARPETGKTTFLADQVSFMAEQTTKPILWFNNEEGGKKVMLRLYQASLGITLEELHRNWSLHYKRFLDLTGDRIKMLDRAQIDKRTVEKLCEKYDPGLILFDQIDKIQGFQNDREDLRLGSIYIWGRELAKGYCPVIGVTQADGTGENQRWLTMNHVANAKTAKQAEADWILGIGKDNAAGMDNIRYLHLSKNKLLGDADSDPEKRHGREEVLINAHIARYADIQRHV